MKTGAYRIDMVVEGAGDVRLAIECDGDEYHGPDMWAHDMNRQRILERAGWVFWRCFASTWTLRKDEVLFDLCQHLDMMGIEPLGALEHTSTMVEKRIWRIPAEPRVAIDESVDELQGRFLCSRILVLNSRSHAVFRLLSKLVRLQNAGVCLTVPQKQDRQNILSCRLRNPYQIHMGR